MTLSALTKACVKGYREGLVEEDIKTMEQDATDGVWRIDKTACSVS